jgi:predicted ATP-dependent serine protease
MWVVGGVPAVGKSTLALQIAIDISGFSGVPTLYYDAENGEGVSLNRVVKSVGLDKARKLGTKLFLRESLNTLTRDLRIVKPPALIVVDSIQKISTFGDDRREGLNVWIRRLEALKKNEGYSVLLLSEIPRDKYTGNLGLDMFKETGALEYAADAAFGMQEHSPFIAMQCVKNRHYEQKGQVALLERARPYWFKEAEAYGARQ